MAYDFRAIEPKWQRRWEEAGTFHSKRDESRPKFYCLEMFPYPSGALHMGHLRNYSIGDLMARFLRMKEYNIMYPMGSQKRTKRIGKEFLEEIKETGSKGKAFLFRKKSTQIGRASCRERV